MPPWDRRKVALIMEIVKDFHVTVRVLCIYCSLFRLAIVNFNFLQTHTLSFPCRNGQFLNNNYNYSNKLKLNF